MRNIILISSLFIVSISMNAQAIIPVEQIYQYVQENKGNVPKHKYYKDVNNVLNKYVGEWEGTYTNKTFYFKISKQIKKVSRVSNTTHYDELKVQYKITNQQTGKVIQDKFKASSKQLNRGMSKFLTKNTYPMDYYADTKKQIGCGDRGLMIIKSESKNKLKIHVVPRAVVRALIEGEPDPCDGVSVDLPFPRSEDKAMILTKKK